jgi:HEAT repeats
MRRHNRPLTVRLLPGGLLLGGLARGVFTFLLCTAAWVGLAPDATPARFHQDPSSAEADAHPDRRRLLKLEDGRIVRARSRTVDEVWQVRRKRAWVPLGEEVVGQRLLAEAIAEADGLRRGLKKNDHARRAELARWMASEGLYEEALLELNRVLRARPQDVAALRVVREAYIPLELSEGAQGNPALALKETLVAGAGGQPAQAEVAVQRLAEFSGRIDLSRLLEIELGVPQPKRRAFAARCLRRLYPGSSRKSLTTRALLDGFTDVREQAAWALAEAEDLAVILPAIQALGNKHTSVRANAAEALGNLGFKAAVEPLMGHLLAHAAGGGGGPSGTRANLFSGLQTAYVMDYDVEIAQAASIADPIVATQTSGISFDVRTTVQRTKVIELRRTMRSLRLLTGKDFGNNPDRWASWWQKSAGQWRALDRAKAFEDRKLAATQTRADD